MKKAKPEKTRKYFLHYYTTDFHRCVVGLVGDPKAAAPELRHLWKDRPDVGRGVVEDYVGIDAEFDYETLTAGKSGATKRYDDGVILMWFPTLPDDCTLVHELVHCMQRIRESLGIQDDEFEAWTVDSLFEHFQAKFRKDRDIPFENPKAVHQ